MNGELCDSQLNIENHTLLSKCLFIIDIEYLQYYWRISKLLLKLHLFQVNKSSPAQIRAMNSAEQSDNITSEPDPSCFPWT